MNEAPSGMEIERITAARIRSPAATKARLLAWAEERDARSLKARSGIGTIAAGGVLAVLGGIAVSRLFTPRPQGSGPSARDHKLGKRLIHWAVLARAGVWLLPHVIGAAHRYSARRIDN